MRVQIVPEKTELSLQNPKNLILVENNDDGVIIRAARDNFSERGKASFIRYLAAEGFISEDFQTFPKSASGSSTSIIWAVDQSWVKHDYVIRQRANLSWCRCLSPCQYCGRQ
jgi:hypothetical protein